MKGILQQQKATLWA